MSTIKITFPFQPLGVTPGRISALFAAAQISITVHSVMQVGNIVVLTTDRALTAPEITLAGEVFRAAYPRIENVEV
jgi:hypothetical protein